MNYNDSPLDVLCGILAVLAIPALIFIVLLI
jgi:hypothetical protein